MKIEEKLKYCKEIGFTYNPETGIITSPYGNIISRKTNGYISVSFNYNGKKYNVRGHQLGWYLYYNEMPSSIIDHKDRVKDNNKINNLRLSNPQQNSFNTNAKGYRLDKRVNKYQAYIKINYKFKSLGYYDTEEDAKNAYEKKKKEFI